MERLAERDLRALLDFLGKVYRFNNVDAFLRALLIALPLLVPADLVAFCDMNPEKKLSHNWTNPAGVMSPALDQAWQLAVSDHPVLVHNVKTGDGRAVRFADFMTQRQHRELALYNEVFRELGIEDGLCAALAVPLPRVVGVGLHREKWSFSERDKLLTNLARPHLVEAWRNARAVTRLQEELDVLQQGLALSGRQLVVLDHRGRIRYATPRARSLIESYLGPRAFSGRRLRALLDIHATRQPGARSATEVPLPRTPLVVEGLGRRLIARLMQNDSESWLLLEEEVDGVAPEALRLLGLTRREADVLAWVAQGKSNVGIARILGMSPRTVQKHLEHIFQKLGVETRTGAARVALDAAALYPG